jgi:hypothetical protein
MHQCKSLSAVGRDETVTALFVAQWLPAVYLLAVAIRREGDVRSGVRAGQATILAPTPNLVLSRTRT